MLTHRSLLFSFQKLSAREEKVSPSWRAISKTWLSLGKGGRASVVSRGDKEEEANNNKLNERYL